MKTIGNITMGHFRRRHTRSTVGDRRALVHHDRRHSLRAPVYQVRPVGHHALWRKDCARVIGNT